MLPKKAKKAAGKGQRRSSVMRGMSAMGVGGSPKTNAAVRHDPSTLPRTAPSRSRTEPPNPPRYAHCSLLCHHVVTARQPERHLGVGPQRAPIRARGNLVPNNRRARRNGARCLSSPPSRPTTATLDHQGSL